MESGCSQRPTALGGEKVKSGDNKNAQAGQRKPPMGPAQGEVNGPKASFRGLWLSLSVSPFRNNQAVRDVSTSLDMTKEDYFLPTGVKALSKT